MTRSGGSLLLRSSIRTYLRQPGQTGLSVLGVALGVAVVLAIGLTTGSAERAFVRAADSVGGRATHMIRGGSNGVPAQFYAALRSEHGVRCCAPIVEGQVRVVVDGGRSGPSLALVGIDPLAEGPLRSYFAFSGGDSGGVARDFTALVTRPGGVAVTRATATSLGWRVGTRVVVDAVGWRRPIEVVAVFVPGDPLVARGLDGVLVCDLATALEQLGRTSDRLDRIDLQLAGAEIQRVRAVLPSALELVPISAQKSRFDELTYAFRVNLQALSLLTLVVGALLVFNTVSISVVRRRASIGVLRALGVGRRQIFRTVLLEALVLGSVGSALGIGLGILLARGMLSFVTGAIADHYLSVTVREVELAPIDLILACGIGVGVCILAALAPAFEAMRVPPREVLLQSPLAAKSRRRARSGIVFASCSIGIGVVILFGSGTSMWSGLVGLFLVLLGAAAATPGITAWIATALAPVCRRLFGPLGAHAARGISADLSRTAVASAALMLAVATTVGIGVMITSFRTTVEQWLRTTLIADVYVSAPASRSEHFRIRLEPAIVDAARAHSDVAAAVALRRFETAGRTAGTEISTVQCVGIENPGRLITSWEPVSGDREAVRAVYLGGGTVVASEPFANRHGLVRGDSIELRTPSGWRSLPIAGVFFDYASEAGYLMMTEPTRLDYFGPGAVSALGLFARQGVDADDLARSVQRDSPGEQVVYAQSNRGLLAASLEVFDRTFEVTRAMRLLCVVIAFFGVWSALMSLTLSRRREIAILRAVGASSRQVGLATMLQTGLLGLAAGAWALPVGAALGWILVHVVNRRSFGWTLLHFEVPASMVIEALVLAVVAALLAGIWPARQFARVRVATALRGD